MRYWTREKHTLFNWIRDAVTSKTFLDSPDWHSRDMEHTEKVYETMGKLAKAPNWRDIVSILSLTTPPPGGWGVWLFDSINEYGIEETIEEEIPYAILNSWYPLLQDKAQEEVEITRKVVDIILALPNWKPLVLWAIKELHDIPYALYYEAKEYGVERAVRNLVSDYESGEVDNFYPLVDKRERDD